MKIENINRRDFIKSTVVLAGATLVSNSRAEEANKESSEKKKTAADMVTLGKTGLKISRLGIGTGTKNGSIQRNLGQEGFNKVIKYAYDQGIRYIDTAQAYNTHTWVREAIKGLPREELFIQSKIMPSGGGRGMGRWGRSTAATPENNIERIEGILKEIDVEYIDSILVHCQSAENWDETNKQLMEDLEKAKEKGLIRSHGVSCHSLPATTKAASLDWVDVNLVRINPQGVNVDPASTSFVSQSAESDVPKIVDQMKIMREKGHGIIGMKLIGEGVFTDKEQRKKSLTWVMQQDIVDAVVIGMKSKEEIDEAIKHINEAFAEKI